MTDIINVINNKTIIIMIQSVFLIFATSIFSIMICFGHVFIVAAVVFPILLDNKLHCIVR